MTTPLSPTLRPFISLYVGGKYGYPYFPPSSPPGVRHPPTWRVGDLRTRGLPPSQQGPPLTFSSMIQRREMKSRSKVTKRQKVRRTSEMALRFSRGGGMKCEERLWLWDSEVPRDASAGKLRSKSQARSPGGLLILVRPHGEAGTMGPQRQGWGKREEAVRVPGMSPPPGTPALHQGPQLCQSPHAPGFTSWQDLSTPHPHSPRPPALSCSL